jgi:hypothetical protein
MNNQCSWTFAAADQTDGRHMAAGRTSGRPRGVG